MKIAVTRCDGDTEIIVLNDPVKVNEGCTQASIHSAEGMDHYFRLSDGCYDGYGCGVPDTGWTMEQAATYQKQIQSERLFIPLTLQRFCGLKVRKIWRYLLWWKGYILQQPGYPRWGEKP